MEPNVLKGENPEVKDLEIASLRKKVAELESQLSEAQKMIQKHLLEANEVDLLKMKSADTLTKAKSVIFENTKMMKNQELQIEALNQQVDSLRDVVKITKDLLEIRNLEVDQLETKIHCMEERHKAEKERQDLMHQRLEQMIRHNGELKREYEAQLCLFRALRERYDERELAKGVVDALKDDIKADKEKLKQPDNQSTLNSKNTEETIVEQNNKEINKNEQAAELNQELNKEELKIAKSELNDDTNQKECKTNEQLKQEILLPNVVSEEKVITNNTSTETESHEKGNSNEINPTETIQKQQETNNEQCSTEIVQNGEGAKN